MIKYYCDFCGKELMEDDVLEIWIVRPWDNQQLETLAHICEKCLQKFRQTIGRKQLEILENKNV